MSFKNFLDLIVESKQTHKLDESSGIKIQFHEKKADLFGDSNTIVVDVANAEIESDMLTVPIYPAVANETDEEAHISVYTYLHVEYDIETHTEARTYDSPGDYEFKIKVNKVKVDDFNTDDDYKELSDNFNEILKDKGKLEKIAEYIISNEEIEELIEKKYFKDKERERDDY